MRIIDQSLTRINKTGLIINIWKLPTDLKVYRIM
jgi:hypothetical protein